MFKCSAVFERASNLLASSKAVLRQQFSYGKQATPDDMSEVGNQCSICQARHHAGRSDIKTFLKHRS